MARQHRPEHHRGIGSRTTGRAASVYRWYTDPTARRCIIRRIHRIDFEKFYSCVWRELNIMGRRTRKDDEKGRPMRPPTKIFSRSLFLLLLAVVFLTASGCA